MAYYAYDNFEKFRRPTNMTVAEFAVEFERLHNKAKAHEMVLPDGILAYKFLNNANISDSREKLIRATMTTLSYEVMKEQLKKIFGDLSISAVSNKQKSIPDNNIQVKVEPQEEFAYENIHCDDSYTKRFSRNYRSRTNRFSCSGFRGRGRSRGNNFGNASCDRKPDSTLPKKNPMKQDVTISKCRNCGSIYLWAKNCPDSFNNYTQSKKSSKDEDHEVSLYSDTMKHFVCETMGTAVLDSGCTKNVCGETWLQCYLETLDESNKMKVKYFKVL